MQLQKMLRLRHERCAKLEDTANDMRREIHALKAAGQYMCTRLLASPPERARRHLSPRIPQRACLDIFTPLFPRAQKTSAAGGRSSCWPTTRSFDTNLKNPEHPSTNRKECKLPRASIQAARRHAANSNSPCSRGRRRTPPHPRLAEPKKESQRSQTREKRPLRLSAEAAWLVQCVLAVIPCHPCPPPPTMPRAGVVQGAWCVQCREAP